MVAAHGTQDYVQYLEKQKEMIQTAGTVKNQKKPQMTQNFFFQPSSPKQSHQNLPAENGRPIKTAGVASSRRVSSQVNSPAGTSYDFNKIKKDLE